MRLLIIDHRDSFTTNLAHLCVAAGGAWPAIWDDQALDQTVDLEGLSAFDAVILSPGPGRADVHADMGRTPEVLAAYPGPMLGVCLGCQAMALAGGGAVGHAPTPIHGQIHPITHGGEGVLAGLPTPLSVVRYHSHAVHRVGATQRVTARAADGVIMALEDTQRPWSGVQFHPESVGAQGGVQILETFFQRVREKTPAPSIQSLKMPKAPKASPTSVSPNTQTPFEAPLKLSWRQVDQWIEPETVFHHLFADSVPAFWLDSATSAYGMGRWSYLGDARGPCAEVWRYTAATKTLSVKTAQGASQRSVETVFAALQDTLRARAWSSAEETLTSEPDAPPFQGGFVGGFGYGLAGEGADAPQAVQAGPDGDGWWLFADRVLAFDHQEQAIWFLVVDAPNEAGEDRSRAWLSETAETLGQLGGKPPPPPDPASPSECDLVFRPLMDRGAYLDAIAEAQRRITAGDTYEVCLTNRFAASAPSLDPWDAYRQLRRVNPAPYGAYLRMGPREALLCASPERFVRISDGIMEAKPIKGTAARHPDPVEDAARAAALVADTKTRAENLMIADVLRNDLGRSAVPGSVETPVLFGLERYAHVHQLVTTVRAKLSPDIPPLEAVRRAFPGGSMTGAPKPRTTEIIDALEGRARGWYAGALGFASLSGAVDLNIVIRTAWLRGEDLFVDAGGAIVALSDPQTECREVWWKARSVIAALGNDAKSRAQWDCALAKPEEFAPAHADRTDVYGDP